MTREEEDKEELENKNVNKSKNRDKKKKERQERSLYILHQLNLEANIAHGRNRNKKYIKERYRIDKLITNIVNDEIRPSLKGMLIKILSNLYVDDIPYEFAKMNRCFSAHTSKIKDRKFKVNEFDFDNQK